jgi:putative hydrolase of the HAD superfamily
MPTIVSGFRQPEANGRVCFCGAYFENYASPWEICMRKPNLEIYNYVLNKHDLQAKHLFSSMIKKTWRQLSLGFQVWNLQVGKEDVVDLFNKK